MRLLLSTLQVFLIWCSCFSFSVDTLDISETSVLRVQKNEALQLTLDIVEQKYCDGSQMRLKLHLHFSNKGSQPIILYKYSTAVLRSLVSLNEKAASAGQYIQDLQFTVNSIGDFEQAGPLKDEFVILQPNKSYIAKTKVIVFTQNSTKANPLGLSAGSYVLQVEVQTWYGTKEVEKKLRKAWKSTGLLWTANTISLPIRFNVEPQRAVVKCSELALTP